MNQLVTIETDPYACCDKAHAFAVCTEWNEFRVRKQNDILYFIPLTLDPAGFLDSYLAVDHKYMIQSCALNRI